MYQCFHCLQNTVCWDCDYDYEDFGYEGEGIVQICHCTNCGAEIEYRIPVNEEIKEEENERLKKSLETFKKIVEEGMNETIQKL